VYEALVTTALEIDIRDVAAQYESSVRALANAEAADRFSRHVAAVLTRVIEQFPEEERATLGRVIVHELLDLLAKNSDAVDPRLDIPRDPAEILESIVRRHPDGSVHALELPLTPLLDTTLLTNAPGEPAIAHELRAEVHSADSIDVVIAFVRFSGIKPLLASLRRYRDDGKRLRVLTTTYTNSTELRALEELAALGAEVRVSYDVSSTRLHAKSWLFHRISGFSTAYIGSSNLTYSAMVTGLEWNVRVSGARNPDVVTKMAAVFESYWESGDFVSFDANEFRERTLQQSPNRDLTLSPIEVVPRPFQARLLEEIALSREEGHHSNLLVAATGTGKTVMAAIDYARLRGELSRARLLFVAHREEILQQSRATFAQVLREASFGELWVGGKRPHKFEYIFASVQSLNASGVEAIQPEHFDVVIIDEFHHAAAPSYQLLLEHLQPKELLGLTATPERADSLDVLRYFDGRIAAELRIWDAIDQQYLAPFSYYGIYDGTDLTEVPWRRGTGYDPSALTDVLTADHAWARRVVEQVRRHVADVGSMRALGFCVSVAHARFMASQFQAAGVRAVAIWADTHEEERKAALVDLEQGRINIVFTVDLFNEGVDVPHVDTLLLLRPTESATLFLQQLGRGLRRADGKALCTVLDFVGNHRREFRFDRKLRALLGGSRRDVERQAEHDFPFLPSGCHLELDEVARSIILRSIREAIPSEWRSKCDELRALGDVSLQEYLENTGLELEDVYANNHSWSEMRRAVRLPTDAEGPAERRFLRALGRLLHVDDHARIDAYRAMMSSESAPSVEHLAESDRRTLRMLVGSVTPLTAKASLQEGVEQLWNHSQVRTELLELLALLPERVSHLHTPLGIGNVPLAVHARYTRREILAAFGIGDGVRPHDWQAGVLWDEASQTDLFAFTLDKSSGSFSPTTRYRDYAISRDLIHWESQSTTTEQGEVGQRYINHRERGTNIVLFARLRATDRAFWCLGSAQYVSHQDERPIAITWRLDSPLPGDLFAQFAAAVA
jgi:superfamily II DNA or RNA helicase